MDKYFGRKALADKSPLEPILYVSEEAHYSLRKIGDIQNIETRTIRALKNGEMDIDDFRKQLDASRPALVAIAILFAILRLRPMPFCLLDEIEAPLDEANVTRLAKYLKRYSHETQFIVITHKKPTMQHADTLFGVTMEEKGVSKLVSVKLSDAIKNTENK